MQQDLKMGNEKLDLKIALIAEFNVENNPKAHKVFDMAWDRGHSEGLNKVRQEFEELVELILP